jgi:hypothetical protein
MFSSLVVYNVGLDPGYLFFPTILPHLTTTYLPHDGRQRKWSEEVRALMQEAMPGVSRRIPVESGPLPRILEAWYLREGRASPEKNLANRFPSLDIPFG